MAKKGISVFFLTGISILAILIAFVPYFGHFLQAGSDDVFHLARIETLAKDLHWNSFPIKIHWELANNYGYGVGFFYCNLFLYIPAILIKLGLSLTEAYKIFAFFIFTGIFISMYISAKEITGNKICAVIGAVLYVLSMPVLRSFYTEFTLGTSLGLVFTPLAIAGIYLFCVRETGLKLLMAGFIGLIYSHVLSTVIAVGVCGVILIYNWKKLYKNKHMRKQFLLAVIFVSAVTMGMWGPMLEQLVVQQLKVSQPWTRISENTERFSNMLGQHGIGYVLVFVTLISIALEVYVLIVKKEQEELWGLLLWGTILCLLPCITPFWKVFDSLFTPLQFTRRLYGPAVIMVILSFVGLLARLKVSQRFMIVILGMFFVFSCLQAMDLMMEEKGDVEDLNGRVLYEEIMGLGAGEEWLPIETPREILTEPDTAIASDESRVIGDKAQGVFRFIADKDKKYYTVPYIWYKGYQAETSDGIKLDTQKGVQGLLQVNLDDMSMDSGEVVIYYGGTWIQHISYLITVLAIIGGGVFELKRRRFS